MTTQWAAALVAGLLTAGCTGAGSSGRATVTASGSGVVTLAPTRAKLSIEVESRRNTPTEASTVNAQRVSAVLAALRLRHIVDSIEVSGIDLSQSTDRYDVPTGFEASTSISFRTSALDSLGVLLEVSLRAGATTIRYVEFEADSMDRARDRALALAYDRAKRDAETLARASGHHLGRLVAETTSRDGYSNASAFEDASVTSGLATLQAGAMTVGPTPRGVSVQATASGRWELAD